MIEAILSVVLFPCSVPVLLAFSVQPLSALHPGQDKPFWTDYSTYSSGLAFCATLYVSPILFVVEQIQQMKCK